MRFNFKEFRNILKSLIDRFSEFFSIIEGISGRKERGNFFSKQCCLLVARCNRISLGWCVGLLETDPLAWQVTRASFVLINAGDGCLFNVDFLNAQGYYGRLCTELQFVFSGGRRLPSRLGFHFPSCLDNL